MNIFMNKSRQSKSASSVKLAISIPFISIFKRASSATMSYLQTTPGVLPVAGVRHGHVALVTAHRSYNKIFN